MSDSHEPRENQSLDLLLDLAPIGVLVIDETNEILLTNSYAECLLGCRRGEFLNTYIHKDDSEKFADLFARTDEAIELQLDLRTGSKTVELRSAIPDNDLHRVVFIDDISEKVALGRQLKSTRQPSRRLLYQLHAATATMMGYTELIDLMLEEESVVSGERLNVIRRYHKEVRKSLDTLNRLLKLEREGGRRPDSTAIPLNRKRIVVIDDEPAIAEYIAELMTGLQYRVAVFTEPMIALEFCAENADQVDLVITDHKMPGMDGGEFVASLLGLAAGFPVVLCTDDADSVVESARTYVCHKPIDISELTRIVSDLIEN